MLTRTLEKASTVPVLGLFRFLVLPGIFVDLMCAKKNPLGGCVLGKPRFLELAEPEPAEQAIVTER